MSGGSLPAAFQPRVFPALSCVHARGPPGRWRARRAAATRLGAAMTQVSYRKAKMASPARRSLGAPQRYTTQACGVPLLSAFALRDVVLAAIGIEPRVEAAAAAQRATVARGWGWTRPSSMAGRETWSKHQPKSLFKAQCLRGC